ncbi:MAG: hypothetical protein AB7U20_15575 [Planctomycetaceae bacterium]
MTTDQISFSSTFRETAALTDEEFVQRLGWRKAADSRLVSAAAAGNTREFARMLSRACKRGTRPGRLKRTTPTLLQPLWSRHAFAEPGQTELDVPLLRELQRRLTSEKSASKIEAELDAIVERSLESAASCPASPLLLLQRVAILSEVGGRLAPPVLFALWRATLATALAMLGDSEAFCRDFADDDASGDCRLLVAGELAWRIGLSYQELRGAGRLRKAGQSCLRDGLEALTDRDGTPHARALHRLPLVLAVFTRSIAAGDAADERLWDAGLAERFESLLGRAAALCHADGRIALSNGASFAPASLLRTASQFAGLSKHEPSAQRLLSLPDDFPSVRKPAKTQMPPVARRKQRPGFDAKDAPSSQSDWAELACLRNNWLLGADSCVVTHHQSRPQICVTAFERVLIDGSWQTDVLLDGEPAELQSEWSCVCWFSDDDADYLELQQVAAGVTRLQQVMLSRNDHWLFLAESVNAPRAGRIELTTRLPLADGVTAEAARWTRELKLAQQKLTATVYPLALDQQRVDHARGSLESQDGEVILRQQGTGTALFAPLVIDWSPDRRRGPSTWRRLTVAEDGALLSAETAAGFRLRIGKHQWMFYRSLNAGKTARTVLGHHTQHEAVIAEFTADGTVEPLVIVE